jgi:threonine/homoserine/homoserine lactone efflux protein
MINILLCFLASFFISFLGSIPPGPINTNVLFLAAQNKKQAAWYFAFGGTFPELFLAFFAAFLQAYITNYPSVYKTISVLFILVLIVMGIVIFFKKVEKEVSQPGNEVLENKYAALVKGIILIVLNPLNVPFWLGIFIFFGNIWSDFNTFGMQLSAGIGAFTGALFLNALLIKSMDLKFVKNLMQPSRTLNRIVGSSYFCLALYQLYVIYRP